MTKTTFRLAALVFTLAMTACSPGPPANASFAAEPGELPFNMTYRYDSALPANERDFLDFLKSHGLDYRLSSGQGPMGAGIDPPQLKRIDLSSIRSTYDIHDKMRSNDRRVVHYIAYVNKADQVIYVENRFQYRGM